MTQARSEVRGAAGVVFAAFDWLGWHYSSATVPLQRRCGAEEIMQVGVRDLLLLASVGAIGLGSPRSVSGQGTPTAPIRTVTAVTAKVNIVSYQGRCPAKLVFTGTITTETVPKVPITYQWVRSDGSKGQRRTVKMTSTTEIVTDTWQLGRAGEQMRVWKKLQILAPTGITSNQVDATVLCN